MARYIARICVNKSCASHNKVHAWQENAQRAQCKIVGKSETNDLLVECGECATQFSTHQVTQKSKATYPHYNASADTVFNSYSEQRSHEKKHGLEPI